MHATHPKETLLAAALLVGILAGGDTAAQEVKVDFNYNNKPLSQTADPAYTPWSTNSIWFAGGHSITNTFGGITFIFTRVGPEGTGLTTDWYSTGIATARLVNDGITVAPHTLQGNGGQIEMRIRGLPSGPHTLLTYHNTWQNPATYSFSPIRISVDGALVITNLSVSNRVTNNADATTAYLQLNATAGQDVIVLFQAETNNSATDKNVCIDGFELNTPNSILKATVPVPADRDEHVPAEGGFYTLSWTPAAWAVSHEVYLGTGSNLVKTATRASPAFKGSQVTTTFALSNLSSLATYFWRVDEVNGTGAVTKGDLWQFRTRHLAFPGAEGYGRFARGGRGGVVVTVANLNDSGPGSLREALTGNYGPRTVVFDVSGLITLDSDLIISASHPCITLAGQTAPGKGICTRKYQLGVSGGRDVIVRHIRSRPGNISGTTLNGSGLSGSDHCVMDHCSISWGIDEELSTRSSKNITVQRVLISEALNIAGHQSYPAGTKHGYAASVGGDVASLHHNLLAHCEGRNWSMAGGLDAAGYFAGRLDIFNNVVYNWGHRTTDGGAHEVNFVNNYYQPGAASAYFYALNAQYGNFPGTQQYYFAGNLMPGRFGLANQEAGRTRSSENGGSLPTTYESWVPAPFFPSYATIHTASNTYKQVLSDVGCNLPVIDDHDRRVIGETINGTTTFVGSVSGVPGLPDSQDDVGGWENYPVVQRPPDWDTDGDGLPNWWEQTKGLNPASAPGDFADSNADPDGDEYTNLEDYLNWMAAPHFDCATSGVLDLDLTQFTRGFTNQSPLYTVHSSVNGTVSLLTGKVARFTPQAAGNALGGFTFTVTDAQGDTMTVTVGVRVVAAVQPPSLAIHRQADSIDLIVTGESGHQLRLHTNASLNTSWSEWTNFPATGAPQSVPLPVPDGPGRLLFRAETH